MWEVYNLSDGDLCGCFVTLTAADTSTTSTREVICRNAFSLFHEIEFNRFKSREITIIKHYKTDHLSFVDVLVEIMCEVKHQRYRKQQKLNRSLVLFIKDDNCRFGWCCAVLNENENHTWLSEGLFTRQEPIGFDCETHGIDHYLLWRSNQHPCIENMAERGSKW